VTTGTLYILPNSLGGPVADILPPQVAQAVCQLDGLIAESDRGGRRFLQQFQGLKLPPNQIPIALLNEHSLHEGSARAEEIDWLLEPLEKGQTWGFVSDAGLPCLADPGAALVARARQKGMRVQVFSGPSAPLLALIASGLPAQRFSFHGYAPKEPLSRIQWIQDLCQQPTTHIWIEAPYRNQAMLDSLLQILPEESLLGLALDLTLPTEEILVTTVRQWRLRHDQQQLPGSLKDRPAVFLMVPRGVVTGPAPSRSERESRARSFSPPSSSSPKRTRR